ncbi:MAG TPA: SDR family oxidoreductase [Flavisolibacter sp.]|jgi:short-subunit dehydrogenase|nr:SDR family oxidoreductase [Flavisolibacter sp.]
MQNNGTTLAEKVIVITGASSGAGRAMAIELAKRGATLMLAARREAALEEVAADCADFGSMTEIQVCDVKDMQSIYLLAKTTVGKFGRIDAWINNAGVLAAGALDEIPAEVNEDVVRTNLLGYIHGAQAVLPIFKAQGYGTLINNISVGGWIATPYMAAYCASKFGLRGFFEALKGELHAYPAIHICDLYPGFLDTPGMQHAANYTGKHIQPAPPVYDPLRVARTVISILQHPKKKKAIGSAAIFLKLAYGLFPGLSRDVTGMVIRNYLKVAPESETTSGNILAPVPFGTGISGGWETYFDRGIKRRLPWLVAGLAVVGLLALQRKG